MGLTKQAQCVPIKICVKWHTNYLDWYTSKTKKKNPLKNQWVFL